MSCKNLEFAIGKEKDEGGMEIVAESDTEDGIIKLFKAMIPDLGFGSGYSLYHRNQEGSCEPLPFLAIEAEIAAADELRRTRPSIYVM